MVRKTILVYLFFVLLSQSAIALHSATYTKFLEYHEMDFLDRNLVNMAFYATLMLCEIPTGVFADMFGRKRSYVLSYFIFATGFMIYTFSSTFWAFVLAEIVLGIGWTFSSGAFDAWLKDKLDFHGCEKSKLRSVFSMKAQITFATSAIFALLGSWLAKVNMSWPWAV